MHPEARAGLQKMVQDTSPLIADRRALRALDLGGRDINGGIRDLFPASTEWTGVDIVPGPGVDIVRDCTLGWPDFLPKFDVVVCTEVLEHVEKWWDLVRTCSQALDTHGILFITAASEGRRPHGASGEMWPPPGEWYRNVLGGELDEVFGELFHYSSVTYNPNPGDIYGWASQVREQKPEVTIPGGEG